MVKMVKTLCVWSLFSSEGQTIKKKKTSKNIVMLESDKQYGERERETGSEGEKVEILNRTIREGHGEKVAFKQKLEGDEGMSCVHS